MRREARKTAMSSKVGSADVTTNVNTQQMSSVATARHSSTLARDTTVA